MNEKERKALRDRYIAEYRELTGREITFIEKGKRKRSIGKYRYSAKKYIVEISSEYLNLDKQHVLGPSRKAPLVKCRHMLSHLLYTMGVSLAEIAELLGNRDHSTIEHGIRAVKGYLKVDKEYRRDYRDHKEHCLNELDKRKRVIPPPLTKEQKEAIIYSLEKGEITQKELAEIYDVSPKTISKYIMEHKKNKKK